MRSEDTVICRPVFSCPGWRRSISPEMMVQTLKERFIRLDSASQASKSSPSMSSSKSRERLRPPARKRLDQDLFGSGNEREFGLEAEPIGHLVGKALPIS